MSADSQNQYLTFTLADQKFGVSVLRVNDVLGPQKITPTPLAPPSVAGVMNLRGRIVTAIDVRRCLGQPAGKADMGNSVVIDQGGELFSLMIDSVGEVLALEQDSLEDVPVTLAPAWRTVASNIHKLQDDLLVILDIPRLLEAAHSPATHMME